MSTELVEQTLKLPEGWSLAGARFSHGPGPGQKEIHLLVDDGDPSEDRDALGVVTEHAPLKDAYSVEWE